jgi:hypothetical protein
MIGSALDADWWVKRHAETQRSLLHSVAMVGVGERAAPTAGALAHGAMPPLRGTMVSGAGGR